MTMDQRLEMEAACHCGAVRFRVRLSDSLNTARRCNCSYCRMRGTVAVSAEAAGPAVTGPPMVAMEALQNCGQSRIWSRSSRFSEVWIRAIRLIQTV
jgi:hypothetical protein